jgi:hypothetical protein
MNAWRRVAGALILLAGGGALLAPSYADREERGVQVGHALRDARIQSAIAGVDTSRAYVDLLVVTPDCVACNALVAWMLETRAVPLTDRTTVLIADDRWPVLAGLAGDHLIVRDSAPAESRAVRARATPTIVTVSLRSRRVVAVDVGVELVKQHFRHEMHEPVTIAR